MRQPGDCQGQHARTVARRGSLHSEGVPGADAVHEQSGGGRLLCCDGTAVDIQFDRERSPGKIPPQWRDRRIPWNMLTDRHTIFLAEEVTKVAGSSFVLHDQLVSTLATVHHPMEQSGAFTWHASRFVVVVFSIVVQKHGLNTLKHLPRHVGWIHIVDTKFPFFHGQPNLLGARRNGISTHAARAPIDKSTSVGRVFEDLQDGRNGGFLPDDVSEAIPSRQGEVMTVEETQHLARRSEARDRW